MKGTGIRDRRLGIALVAALGVIAMLALPSFAAASGGHHHHGHHGRRHFMSRHGSRRVLIRGSASNTAGSPTEGENAGEVESFEGGTLTIKLFAGGTVSGKVTESTEIECEHQSTEVQSQSSEDQGSEDSQEGGENGSENSGAQSQQSDDQSSGDQSSGDEAEASDATDQSGSSGSSSCGTASLTKGAIVHEAELVVGSHGAVFQSVDLAG